MTQTGHQIDLPQTLHVNNNNNVATVKKLES